MYSLMKKMAVKLTLGIIAISFFLACSQKSGCPSNGKNVGAERILSGEKTKAKKFKA
jgi:hypothetical protein